MTRKYSRVQGEKTRAGTYPDDPNAQRCKKCKQEFVQGDPMTLVRTEYTWMRGDDEHEYYHPDCAPNDPEAT